ncbi:FAD-dependent oxidoreductase [Lacisediminihabitans sp.]|jgi:glycine/D-amino acid oxidase-like deaminating enzyme|uniref:FAD-dependent oxidoreductase n=1 Tax=Lacisediminihabitans sp. TaxID=2787631 RepID=UPI002F9514C4
MPSTADVVVVGGGAMGSAAARELARRGRDVTLLERFEPGHVNGASHVPRGVANAPPVPPGSPVKATVRSTVPSMMPHRSSRTGLSRLAGLFS